MIKTVKAVTETGGIAWARWLLITMGLVTCFGSLGSYPLLDPDEGRYAEIPREMRELGDWITPRLNYLKYFEKPPAFYWLVGGMQTVFGEKEAPLRAVPAAAAFIALLMVIALGTRCFSPTAGLIAGAAWLGTVLTVAHSRMLIIDGVFSCVLTATWICWFRGYRAKAPSARRNWTLGAWALLAVAVMTKGPAALILTGLIVLGFLAWQRDLRALRSMA